MPIKFPCPNCSLPLRIDRKFAGRSGKCPSCLRKLTVPELQIGDPDQIADEHLPNDRLNVSEFNDQIENKSGEPTSAVQDISFTDDPNSVETQTKRPNVIQAEIASNTSVRNSPENIHTEPGSEIPAAIPGSGQAVSVFNELVKSNSYSINLPRWIILTQGALLGTVAITFFLFGMMMGSLTTKGQPNMEAATKTQLSGSVFAVIDNERIADMGAVVIVLPIDSSAETRPDLKLLRPDSYKAIDNKAKKIIEEAKGKVVRVNSEGMFTAFVDQNMKYQVLVISKNAKSRAGKNITKQMRAELGGFFLPLEELIRRQDFDWQEVVLTTKATRLNVVLFD